MSTDTDVLETDSLTTDSVTSDDGYLRLGIPESTDTDTGDATGLTGTYVRLGTYTSTEEDTLPENVGLTASVSAASGIFMKTNGALAVRVDGNAYEQFLADHSIRIEGNLTVTTLGASVSTAEEITIYANSGVNDDNTTDSPGRLSLKGSNDVFVSAESKGITIDCAEDFTTTTGGSNIEKYKGKWRTVAYHDAWSFFGGLSIDFYLGMQIGVYGSAVIQTYAMYLTYTAIGDVHICSGYNLDTGIVKINIATLDVSRTLVEVTNKVLNLKNDNFFIKWINISIEKQDIHLSEGSVDLKSKDLDAGTSSVVRMFM